MDSKRRLTAPEWAAILHEQDQSGMSASLFARKWDQDQQLLLCAEAPSKRTLPEKREDLSKQRRVVCRRVVRIAVSGKSLPLLLSLRFGSVSQAHFRQARMRQRSACSAQRHQLHVDAGFDADHLRRLIYVLDVQA